MSGPRRVAAAAAAAAVVAARAPAQAPLGAPPAAVVRSGVTVVPDTVTVGEPFEVRVRVSAPAGSAVTFPAAPDSGGPVAALDPRRESPAREPAGGGGVDVTATYRLAAWDVGSLPVGLADVRVRAGGAERRVPLGALRVTVRSVLPADSARRVPKPLREPLADAGWWWLRYLLAALAAAAAVGLLVWWAVRRRRAHRGRARPDAAYREALAAFDQLDRLGLVAAGEGARHAALAADILREYLAARLAVAPRALTTRELAAALAERDDVDAPRLAGLLGEVDVVKFAGLRIAPDAATGLAGESRAVVEATEAAVREREAREAAEAAERARQAREAQRAYEEAQRRAAARARAAQAAGAPPADDDQERAA